MNHHSGGAVIAPWEFFPEYSLDEWIEAAHALSGMSSIRARKRVQENWLEKQRRAHKQYARYHYKQ